MISPCIASFYLKHHYAALELLTFFNRLFYRFTWSWTAAWFVFPVNLCMSSFIFMYLNAGVLFYCQHFRPALVLFWIARCLSHLFSFPQEVFPPPHLTKNIENMRLVTLVIMDDMHASVYCHTLSGFGWHLFVSFGGVIQGDGWWVMQSVYPLKACSTLNLDKDWTLGMADWTWGQCCLCHLERCSQGGDAERKLTTRAEHSVTR